jgi:hypothetical protein
MIFFKEKWNKWELEKAYSEEKPKWIYLIGVISLAVIAFTWYQVITLQVKFSWIIAALVTLTIIKVASLLFNYSAFRAFAASMLNDRIKMMRLNAGVFIYSIVLVAMGVFLY